jgi:hypothetical protein
MFGCSTSFAFIHGRPASISHRLSLVDLHSSRMQVLPPEHSRLRSFCAFAKPTDDVRILRIRSTCDVLVEMNNGAKDLSWKDAFWTMAETSLQEAEDLMLSLPYAQIRQQIYRLAPALEIVRVANFVCTNSGDSSSVLVDIELKNTIAREHHKYATANGGFSNRGVAVLPSPYSGSHEGTSSQSRLEIVKNELQAPQRPVFWRNADQRTAMSATRLSSQ